MRYHRIRAYKGDERAVEWEALGWRFDDPPGWLQIIEPDDVTFLKLSEWDVVVVPNLGDEVVPG